ncbi:MAG: porin [Ferruginibacter sp.]|nr:porin [Rhodoferax sp.]
MQNFQRTQNTGPPSPTRTRLALAALLACGITSPVHAQSTQGTSSVTLYGILDQSIEHLTHTNAAGTSITRLPNLTGSLPSRFGFRGTEDLGNGQKAVFALESGIALDTGSLNNGGRLFGRFAYVGVGGPWGTITAGRLANMGFFASTSEIFGGNLYGNASLDPYLPNARSDNTVGYMGTFSNVTVGATYSLGRDTVTTGGPAATNCPGEGVGGASACRQWTAMVKYDSATLGGALSHDVMHGGPTALLGLNNASYDDSRTLLNGYAVWGGTKISGGLLHRHRSTATDLSSNLWYLGASYPVTPALSIDAQISRLDVKNSDADATLAVVRGTYALSKRTNVYAMLGHIRNSGTSAVSLSAGATVGVGMGQSGFATGMRHTF